MLSTVPTIEIEAGSATDSRAEEIYRNLQVLYGTVAGEQALDRDFGIDPTIMDNPSENAEALLTAEYVRKTQRYEPRARVNYVNFDKKNNPDGFIKPKVVIEIV